MTFDLLRQSTDDALALADAIRDLKQNVKHCSQCFNVTEADPCSICADPRRDGSTVLVVEQPNDVMAIETTGTYRGVYHVLMGRLAALDGIGPGELNVTSLLERARGGGVREVIIGTNPTLEGDGTALYLAEQLGQAGLTVSRLARGMATGSSLQTASKAVLADALEDRRPVQ